MDIKEINDTMQHAIDMSKNAIYVVVNGNISVFDEMAHGTDTIHWNRGNVDVERSQRIRCNNAKEVSGDMVKRDIL